MCRIAARANEDFPLTTNLVIEKGTYPPIGRLLSARERSWTSHAIERDSVALSRRDTNAPQSRGVWWSVQGDSHGMGSRMRTLTVAAAQAARPVYILGVRRGGSPWVRLAAVSSLESAVDLRRGNRHSSKRALGNASRRLLRGSAACCGALLAGSSRTSS
jgi:hypothetical protein